MPITLPTPRSLPFNVCIPTGRTSYCVAAEDTVIGGRRDCGEEKTPPLASASITYSEEVITWNGVETRTSVSFWIGIEENLNAIWVGDSMGNCARIFADPPSPSASIDDTVDHLGSYTDDVAEQIDDLGGPSEGSTGNDVLIPLAIIVIAILFVITGGAAFS
ncbi:hypothetical protein [Natronolimnohabitans innermongolicus]|uniref:hypothetical protein n=1 Tax=Natronolimnohabitans innermongolicus TaxID=253107 RepID=UPI001375B807|nr:hypothetical protein [Natronolimnohabitans innermongolicus]